jgi:L-fuconolactonase
LVEELLADTGTGHNVEATVFIECRTNYRTDGPIETRSVGEVEFVANLASRWDAEHRGATFWG